MKKLLGSFKLDFSRAFLSFGFFCAIIGMCMTLVFNTSTEFKFINEFQGDILYLYRVAHFHAFSILWMIFAVLPYSTNFCTDWNNQFIRSTIIRSNIKNYGISKVFSCAIAGGSGVALGEILFILLCRLFLPLVNTHFHMFENAISETMFGDLLISGNFITYFAVKILLVFLGAALFAVLALWISTYITNVFVIFASPIIAYYFINTLHSIVGLPRLLNLHAILSGMVYPNNILLSVAYSVFIIVFFIASMGTLIVHQIERRLEHG